MINNNKHIKLMEDKEKYIKVIKSIEKNNKEIDVELYNRSIQLNDYIKKNVKLSNICSMDIAIIKTYKQLLVKMDWIKDIRVLKQLILNIDYHSLKIMNDQRYQVYNQFLSDVNECLYELERYGRIFNKAGNRYE